MLKTRADDIIGTNVLDDRDVLYTRQEAAEYLRKSVPTLERWAKVGIGPKPIPCGPRGVRYRLSDLRAFTGASATDQAA
jgi:Helix-turn-helix domain